MHGKAHDVGAAVYYLGQWGFLHKAERTEWRLPGPLFMTAEMSIETKMNLAFLDDSDTS